MSLLQRILRPPPRLTTGDMPAASPAAGEVVLRTLFEACGFQDSDATALRYIYRIQPSAEGTLSTYPVILPPTETVLEDEQTHFDAVQEVLTHYPPNFHIECDVYGRLDARYLVQSADADYTLDIAEHIATTDLSDDIRTVAIHRGMRRTSVNIADVANGGAVFQCDLSDLTGTEAGVIGNVSALIDGALGDRTPGHWDRIAAGMGWRTVWRPGTATLWGPYVEIQNTRYVDPRLVWRDLFVLKLPDNNSTAPLDHNDRDTSDKRQPIGLVQVCGGAGTQGGYDPSYDVESYLVPIQFTVAVLYYNGVYTGGADYPPLSSSLWQALCDGGESEKVAVSTHEWAELDDETIGHKFAKYLLVRLMWIDQPVAILGGNAWTRHMATFQEMRVWLPEQLYGYAKLGATAPYNTADDQALYNQYRPRTYMSDLDFYANTQAEADGRAKQALGELYRNYARLRVTGIRPDANIGQTVRVTSAELGVDQNYLIESVTVRSDGMSECEMTAYRV